MVSNGTLVEIDTVDVEYDDVNEKIHRDLFSPGDLRVSWIMGLYTSLLLGPSNSPSDIIFYTMGLEGSSLFLDVSTSFVDYS